MIGGTEEAARDQVEEKVACGSGKLDIMGLHGPSDGQHVTSGQPFIVLELSDSTAQRPTSRRIGHQQQPDALRRRCRSGGDQPDDHEDRQCDDESMGGPSHG